MIIKQTTTIVFEYPQDYLQEQEWCKTKEERWIHKSTDTLGAVYENTISYSIGQPSSSENPNNCEDLQDWKDRMWTEAIVTEPTISKMEQVDKDINVRSNNEPQTEEPPMDEYYKDHDEFYCDRYVITNDEGERAYNCIGCQTDCAWR